MTPFDYFYVYAVSTILAPFVLLLVIAKYITKNNKVEDDDFKYQYLLESPSNYYYGKEDIDGIPENNPLMITLKKYCIDNDVFKNGAIVSLSGGVDSMVTLACLLKLRKQEGISFPICAASIDYSQRDEQHEEVNFLKDYCRTNNVKMYIAKVEGYSRKKENSGPRTEFEEESRKIRFELYKQIIDEYGCTGVFVGHHKDDIIENIFTNSMKGGNLLDLEVMKKKSTIHNVNIFRPFLEFHKNVIFELSHKCDIPYFLDTTPKWSRRGKMRFEIFPLLDNVFSPSWRVKLKELGEQSNQWGNYIQEYVVNPWFNKVIIKKYGFIMPFSDQPKLIYTNVLLKCMHKIGKHMLKSSSVDKIISNRYNFNKSINLDSGLQMYVNSNNPDYFIIYNKDELQKEITINPIKISQEPLHASGNIYENFINGNISFKQPSNMTKDYQINNKNYVQMDTKLPKDILKVFTFTKSAECLLNQWINTGL